MTHPGGFDFIDSVAQVFQPERVVFIGDVLDHHGISNWTKHSRSLGTMDEYELALECVQEWYTAYPDAIVTIGNHDERPTRLAEAAGVPGAYLKDYAQVWQTPRWHWTEDITLDTGDNAVYFMHGTGRSGKYPASNLATDMTMSCVMGHVHHAGGIKWFANPNRRWFGLDTGALIDDRLYAFAYGKPVKKKTVLGCGVVNTRNPMETQYIAMPAGKGEMFNRDNYEVHPLLKGRYA